MASFTQFIADSLTEAGKLANNSFGKVTGTTKEGDNNQVLTETDLAVGRLLVEKVHAEYPDHNIIDEEAGVIDKGNNYTWVIDPIDGTSNFANGVPTYCILFGLLEGSEPIAGGVILPEFNQLYLGEKDQPSTRNGEVIHVTAEKQLSNCLVSFGIDGHPEDLVRTHTEIHQLKEIVLNSRNLRASGSVFDMMLTADGRYGGNINTTSKIWDNVAPQVIIEGAGGIFTDLTGNRVTYENPLAQVDKNYAVCMSSPHLHPTILQLIQRTS